MVSSPSKAWLSADVEIPSSLAEIRKFIRPATPRKLGQIGVIGAGEAHDVRRIDPLELPAKPIDQRQTAMDKRALYGH
jgi:hypothetical protein